MLDLGSTADTRSLQAESSYQLIVHLLMCFTYVRADLMVGDGHADAVSQNR